MSLSCWQSLCSEDENRTEDLSEVGNDAWNDGRQNDIRCATAYYSAGQTMSMLSIGFSVGFDVRFCYLLLSVLFTPANKSRNPHPCSVTAAVTNALTVSGKALCLILSNFSISGTAEQNGESFPHVCLCSPVV